MNRSLVEITRDLLLNSEEFNIFESEDLRIRIDELRDERADKEDGLYFFFKDFDQEIILFNVQVAKAQRYIRWLKNEQERLKAYVVSQYQLTGDLPEHSALNPIKVRESSGAVDVIDEDKIPEEYFNYKKVRVLNKKLILSELKEGKQINGVRLAKKDFVVGLK